jgi:hypothetical protein
MPGAHQGKVIVTTSSSEGALGYSMRVKKLKPVQDDLKILEHSSGRKGLASGEPHHPFS